MHRRQSSSMIWRWCGSVCTPATTARWTPVALNTSLQVCLGNTTDKSWKYVFFMCALKNTFCVTGEIKGGKVSGFHNWIQFYLLEKRGKLNYYSHSFNGPVSIHNKDPNVVFTLWSVKHPLYFLYFCSQWTTFPDVLGMQFKWDGYFKQVGSAVIGCSPEFDFALYSLCYITRPGKQWVNLRVLWRPPAPESFLICINVRHAQVSSQPGRKDTYHPNLHLGQNYLWEREEVHRLCLSFKPLKLPSDEQSLSVNH